MSINHITTTYLRSSLSQDAGQHASPKELVLPPKDTTSQRDPDSELRSYSEFEAEQRGLSNTDSNGSKSEKSRTDKLRAKLANVARIMSYGRAPRKP